MHGHHLTHIDDPGPAKVPAGLPMVFLVLGAIGIVVFLAGAFGMFGDTTAALQKVWVGFFVSYLFFYFLSLGAAAFLAINYITNAKWYIVFKRPLESLATFSYSGGFIFPLVGLAATGLMYSWSDVAGRSYPYAGTLKAAYLMPGLHAVKVIIYVTLLSGLTFWLNRTSIRGGKSGDDFRAHQKKVSIIYMIIFAPVFSLFCVDVIKSLEPKWFSTMFGVYCFIGAFLSAMAVTMMMAFWLRGKTPHAIAERHMHDMGTYVMAFATFMVYIGFSQYMLIWYANVPEEIFYFMRRQEGGWEFLTLALPLFKWVIPFFLLMPPPFRTKMSIQIFVCCSILFGQLLDIYWMVAPAIPVPFGGDFITFSEQTRVVYFPDLVNIMTFIGVGGVFGFTMLNFLGKHSVLPMTDPDLLNSVNGDYLHA